MGLLRTAMRNSLPPSEFGMPGERKYPLYDRSHAANAKARASQQEAKGNISASTKAQIDAKANRVLGTPGASGGHPHKNLGKYLHPKKS